MPEGTGYMGFKVVCGPTSIHAIGGSIAVLCCICQNSARDLAPSRLLVGCGELEELSSFNATSACRLRVSLPQGQPRWVAASVADDLEGFMASHFVFFLVKSQAV